MKEQQTILEQIKKGEFKSLFLKYKEDEKFREKMDTFRAGYYSYGRSGCGNCLECLGATVCLDTLCECGGGDLCNWF
ncbi:hypothetical protein X928_06270 [Petrotoga miotherma DSM 10691]|uniref:Uncharacterized protein n=1 Tax=Petrotoga miotherma DSM 10691 TaxID=1434326 RepID=A0A2K1PAS4_9BACT|nr:hypothetical protein [Petrotoga sp.]PNR99891.1 hypothetical protein X928_06270 [Petrotoga miotherma DSM 10691]